MTRPTYLLVFGRTPDLAFAELTNFYPTAERISQDVARIAGSDIADPEDFLSQLGGAVKIAQEVGTVEEASAQTLTPFVNPEPQLYFGVSVYGTLLPVSVLPAMKQLLEKNCPHVRYAQWRHGQTVSSVSVDKKAIQELIVVKTQEGFVVGKTIAVQDYEGWGERDYGRPFADAKAGMLPPKVARMLVNIVDMDPLGKAHAKKTLLDPFCGMGTVLAEGYMRGWQVTGSDISEDVVRKAKDNMRWLTKSAPHTGGSVGSLFVHDAVHLSEKLEHGSIDAIVTEPYMGTTSMAIKHEVDIQKVKNIIKGLEKLYIGCLRNWHTLLVSGGRVVIALPGYAVSGRILFVKKVVDMCENLGYTIVVGPIEYSRPQAVVKRMFYILEKI